jgi:hypothetical protein
MAESTQIVSSNKACHSAVASAIGFEYQFERLLYRLATGTFDTVVGIETDDDITFMKAGVTTLEQDKFLIKHNRNPFANTSENLWKTLLNWINCVKKLPKCNYCFLFTSNVKINRKPNSLIWKIADAKDEKNVLECILTLRKIKNSSKPKLLQIMNEVKKCDDNILVQIITNASISDNAKICDEDLITALELPIGIEGSDLLKAMRGWVHSVVINNWVNGKPCLIDRQQYIDAKYRYCQYQKRFRKLERPYRDIIISEKDRSECVSKTFINQIFAIQIELEDIANEEIKNAIEDYLRFYIENSRLLEEGEITNHEWKNFFNDLQRRWQRIRSQNMSKIPHPTPTAMGRDIYFDTLAKDYRAPLATQQTTEIYLTNGGYHFLADEKTVYWHPDFLNNQQLNINHGN